MKRSFLYSNSLTHKEGESHTFLYIQNLMANGIICYILSFVCSDYKTFNLSLRVELLALDHTVHASVSKQWYDYVWKMHKA